MRLETEVLIARQEELLRALGDVNERLGAQDWASTRVASDEVANLAQFFVDELVRRGYDPGRMAQAEGWIRFFVEKRIHLEAARRAEADLEREANERLTALRSGDARMV